MTTSACVFVVAVGAAVRTFTCRERLVDGFGENARRDSVSPPPIWTGYPVLLRVH